MAPGPAATSASVGFLARLFLGDSGFRLQFDPAEAVRVVFAVAAGTIRGGSLRVLPKSESCRGPEYCGHTSLNYVDAVAKRIRGKEWQVLKEDEFTWMHELAAEMKHNAEVAKKWAEVRE